MSNLKPRLYQETNTQPTRKFIETGAYRGDGIAHVLPNYEEVHSVELSETWYRHCVERFKDEPKVHMHFGNSKYVLPELLATINEAVTIYLDSHFSAGETAFGEESINGVSSTPLEKELELLRDRKYDDIIIIDDCHMVGKKGWINKGRVGGTWPGYEYDWTNITEDRIRELMKPGYVLIKNEGGFHSDGPWAQWILAPHK